MKRLLCVCVMVTLCLAVLSGCGWAEPSADDPPEPPTFTEPVRPQRAGEVTITTQQRVYPVGVEEITVTWHNGTDYDAMFGEAYQLQKWGGSVWVDVEENPLPENHSWAFMAIGYFLPPGESREHTYHVGEGTMFGPLEAGRYRIVTSFHFDDDVPIGPDDSHEVYAEFEVA